MPSGSRTNCSILTTIRLGMDFSYTLLEQLTFSNVIRCSEHFSEAPIRRALPTVITSAANIECRDDRRCCSSRYNASRRTRDSAGSGTYGIVPLVPGTTYTIHTVFIPTCLRTSLTPRCQEFDEKSRLTTKCRRNDPFWPSNERSRPRQEATERHTRSKWPKNCHLDRRVRFHVVAPQREEPGASREGHSGAAERN